MKLLKYLLVINCLIGSLSAVTVVKKGIIPTYNPYDIGVVSMFFPYNPNIIMVGDNMTDVSTATARLLEQSNIFVFSPGIEDYENLTQYSQTLTNIHPYFGLIDNKTVANHVYYDSSHQIEPYKGYFWYSGSLLKPKDHKLAFLFNGKRCIPTFSLLQFSNEQHLSKVHFFYLNTGGNELRILKSSPDLVKNAIVVCVKTYHYSFRHDLTSFSDLHQYMTDCDYVLMSHHVYDNIMGDALYIKRKYFRAVFQIKEI